MKIARGNYRIVIIIGRLAIKLPRIRFKAGIKCLLYEIKNGLISRWYRDDILYLACSKTNFFGGLICNWQEYKFYRETKLPILMPTYFSLFGLFNVQKAGHQRINMDSTSLFVQLNRLSDHTIIELDQGHAFEKPDNFCVEAGKIMMLDYAEEAEDILRKYGQTIQDQFDFSYSWEEEK